VWDPAALALTTTITLSEERALTVSVREGEAKVIVESAESVKMAERTVVREALQRMLRLDEDLFKPNFDEPQQEEDDEVLYFTT
jgi:hypothetical protein